MLAIGIWTLGEIRGQEFRLASPDGQVRVEISLQDQLRFRVLQGDRSILEEVSPALHLENDLQPGVSPRLARESRESHKEILTPVVPLKSSSVLDEYNELLLDFKGKYSLRFRAYDNGLAYRFETGLREEVRIRNERMDIRFSEDYIVYYPEEEKLTTNYEHLYRVMQISEIKENSFCSLPVLFATGDKGSLLITEADVHDYPHMFLEKSPHGFGSKFPKQVLSGLPEEGETGNVREDPVTADYIALTDGARTFPWRVFVLAREASDLLECNLVWQLSRPLKLKETDWIRPGKVAWEWWNASNLKGVDFETGVNTATYKYYIDFAHEYGLEYILIDEGWSVSRPNIKDQVEDIDVVKLVRYGEERDVGIILWVYWSPLDRELNEILDLYRDWGVKGIKIDFMNRSDQYMVNFYERVVREAAKRKMVVDFHGAFKPGGLRRAYPNLLNYEGVRAMEYCKWSRDITPEHDLTVPFIRMVAGPMDYTPGAMDNAQEHSFFPRHPRPMSQGTRCHQLAMFVLYEAPFQMLADSPTKYYLEDEFTRFLSRIPTVYDESIVLEAEIADYLVMAKRNGDAWYIGGMTDWTPRSFEIKMHFLAEGEYRMEIFEDGINAEKWASDYKRTVQTVNSDDQVSIRMSKGGGWTAILTREPGQE